jgi:hypothetical protein
MVTPIRKVLPSLLRSSQNSEILNNIQMTWTGFDPGRAMNVASTGRNYWIPLNIVQLTL